MAFGVGKRWWRKASGISNAQRKLSRKIDVPLSGRKSFKVSPGDKGCGFLLLVGCGPAVVVSSLFLI
jgi:hypothetical protein